jgi:hypothetical protein
MKHLEIKPLNCSKYFNINDLKKTTTYSSDIVFFGKMVITNKSRIIRKMDLHSFFVMLKRIIDDGYVTEFLLVPSAMWMQPIDIVRNGIFVDDNLLSINDKHGNEKSALENIQYNTILMSYFKSTLTRKELNDMYYNTSFTEICVEEFQRFNMW